MEETKTCQVAEHGADRRTRELYRYYQPGGPTHSLPAWLSCTGESRSSGSTGSSNTRVRDSSVAGSNSSATSTPSTAIGPEALILGLSNNTLTSFAQLAALRLNVERALICVLDRDKQYILSEATKSVSLNDHSVHNDKDAIWSGNTNGEKAWSLCKDTVALSSSNRETADYSHLVVNDLSKNERYSNLPFVQNDPHFRFYAGTPLTTHNGINLGCFFVLDKEPRDGLTALEKDTLGSLTMLVMDYLKVCRQASEGRRAARLSRGLSYFVDGSSSFVESVDPSRADSLPSQSVTPSLNNRLSTFGDSRGSSLGNSLQFDQSSQNERSYQGLSGQSNSPPNDRSSHGNSVQFDQSSQNERASRASSGQPNSPPNDRSPSNDAQSVSSGGSKLDTGTSGGASSLPEWITSSSRNQLPPDDSHGNSWCFRRAANLLRESLDLRQNGGVIFLESQGTPFSSRDSGSEDSMSDSTGPATVLSMSTEDEPFAPRAGAISESPAASLDRSFLQLLLRRYPKGKIWSFHRDGLISTSDDDDDDDDDHNPRNTAPTPSNPSPPGLSPIDVTKPMGKRRKAAENTLLNQYFPEAVQIMFVPLWNAVNSQWFAGCFCWIDVETQVFTSAVELSSVLGFGSSIMAEYSRVESLIADRQKGDFIGSISHELRSPLHGILAAAEFLNDTNLSEFQGSLLETVNACGRTLLDTMNQVLDFSKVVSLERTWRSLKRRKESPLDFKGTDNLGSHLDSYVVTDLAILAEEVVEGICLGLAYGNNSGAHADLSVLSSSKVLNVQSGRSQVDVIIDVAQGDWIYRTQPGALRRIIMNIFGNAMKYTDSGRVTLSLEATSRSEGRSRRQGLEDLVTLTVSDTGRGISEEFLRGKLYTPFAQEDSLAVGTGLGLSIVKSLVKALNGHIRVRSRPGEGTVVRVSLPLARAVGEESPPVHESSHNPQQIEALTKTLLLREGFPGKRAAIWGVDVERLAEDQTWAEIAKYLTEWFGVELVAWPSPLPLDMLVIEESVLPELRKTPLTATLPSLLILCHQPVDYSQEQTQWLALATSVEIIRRPCGPHKLARSVLKCFQNSRSSVVTPATVISNPMDSIDLVYRTPPITSALQSAVTSPVSVSNTAPFDEPLSAVAAGSGLKSLGESSPNDPSMVSEFPEAIAAAPLPMPSVGGSSASSQLARVLVVDDNRINLNLMMTFMKKRNLTDLVSADNGKLAVEAAERMQMGFDIIFMDISMPVMNGFEATRAIRAMEKENDNRRPAVIIALTGLSSLRDESEALSSGVDMFLTKPVSFREVSRILAEWEANGLEKERKIACKFD
ncbi:hypothetical protein N7481_012312 [Penicillium waksmanii]|uniref:uncharacterized protein n=1 Tax=Penicillium waksmanii TaxID=69791 RepID=UPI0025467E5B|nr:uncharacterized protein N7481_012312 [Penicillium waksmanii]KAJ5965598.1 hypothetical protein N7481_012312 [Penicillium waksmanii]